jgi:hypothetical protein
VALAALQGDDGPGQSQSLQTKTPGRAELG